MVWNLIECFYKEKPTNVHVNAQNQWPTDDENKLYYVIRPQDLP